MGQTKIWMFHYLACSQAVGNRAESVSLNIKINPTQPRLHEQMKDPAPWSVWEEITPLNEKLLIQTWLLLKWWILWFEYCLVDEALEADGEGVADGPRLAGGPARVHDHADIHQVQEARELEGVKHLKNGLTEMVQL